MRLKRVQIHGFRSIEEMKISFDGNGHKILVGKNESGKSNILNALNLLSGDTSFKQEDAKESYNKPAFVRFNFELDKDEIDKCKAKFVEKFLEGQDAKLTKDHTVSSFFEKHSKYILYEVQCGKDGFWTYWRVDESLRIEDGWYSVNPQIVDYELHEQIPADSYISERYIEKQIHENDREAIRNCLSPISLEDVHKFLRQQVKAIVAPENYTFPIRYWRYAAQEHDLPSSIAREAFSQRTDSCIPLKNMFLLAGIEEKDIQDRISEANNIGHNRLQNLYDRVSNKTNEYIKKTWKEYNNVAIKLRSDGERIVVGIRDSENLFNFNQRSDGFRRLVSFLLLISTELDTKQYLDTPLILIDEPETGLHPSSAKDLKYKLIKLGKTNTVIYATHSISMIDTENIQNNLIVEKNNENTTIKEAKEDGTAPPENVYQVIGHSIYEDLKQKNILLEGYTDKQPLSLFMKGRAWKGVGICYTGGVRNIRPVISILELASRKYFVLSDVDEAAKSKKSAMRDPDFWYTYRDLGSDAITIEDFYEEAFFMSVVQKILKKYGIDLAESFSTEENNRMESIKRFLLKKHKDLLENSAKANNLEDAAGMVKQINGEIKIECANTVKERNVMKEKITAVLNSLLQKINDSQNPT